jgi:hypothetical protein
MILYLRDKTGKTLLDLELYVKNENDHRFIELSSSVIIDNYSRHLLSIEDPKEQIIFITYFDQLSEIRGWLWEVYFMGGNNDPKEYDNVLFELKEILKKVADEFNLNIVED